MHSLDNLPILANYTLAPDRGRHILKMNIRHYLVAMMSLGSAYKRGIKLIYRADLNDAAQPITTLFNIGVRLKEDERYWSHWKNKEDYAHIYSLPNEQKWPMELIYSCGRSFCGDVGSYTNQFVYDHAEYPTATEIVKTLERYILKLDFDKILTDALAAKDIVKFDNNFAFDSMCDQFKRQMKIVVSLKKILNTLRDTDQYKSENGMPKSKNSGGIYVQGSNYVNISSASPNSQQTIAVNDGFSELIDQMIEAVKTSSAADKEQMIAAIDELRDAKVAPESRYRTFIARVKDNMPLFTPFIVPLTTYLLGV